MHQPTRDDQIEALFAPVSVRSFSATVSPELIGQLRAEERAVIAPMAAARQAEFATARACARAALAGFGVDAAIPRREGGSPEWPSGMAGSISHTRGFCVAVASNGHHTLGIDVEEIERMKPAVERRILVDLERLALGHLNDDDRRQRVATIFAAKEAFYKAHYEVEARYLGFDAVVVTVDNSRVSFGPSSGAVSASMLDQCRGKARVDQGRVIVGVAIDTAALAGPLPSPA